MDDLDYYEILGIEHSATAEEIKAAYRQLSKKYHPDANDAKNANTFFRLIHDAYEVLSNPEKRKAYDNRNIGKSAYTEKNDKKKDDYAYDADTYMSKNVHTDSLVKIALMLIGKLIAKIFLLPLVILLLFFNFLFGWFGGVGTLILKLLSGFIMVSAILILVISLVEGNFKEEILTVWPLFIVGFVFSTLAYIASFLPALVEEITEKAVALFFKLKYAKNSCRNDSFICREMVLWLQRQIMKKTEISTFALLQRSENLRMENQ